MSRLRTIALAVLPPVGLALLVVAVLAPSWHAGSVIGGLETDVWPHVWGYWWIGQSVLGGDGIPFQTALLKYPEGGSLFFPDLAGALLSIPLQLWLSLEASYDLVLGAKLFLVGLGAYLLCLQLTGSRLASWIAGACLLTAPYLLAEAHNGISENLNFGWAALFAAALVRLERGSWPAGVAAGVLFFLTFLGSWYYALGALGLGALWLVDLLLDGRRRSFAALAAMLIAVVLSTVLVFPLARLISRTLSADVAIVTRDHRSVTELFESTHNAVDPLSFVVPGDYHSPDYREDFGEDFFHVSYLGWLLLVSAGVGFGLTRSRRLLLWLVAVPLFGLFALGPFLFVAGRYVTVSGYQLQLPFALLFEHVPFFDLVGHPQRFVPFAMLGLVALGSAAWAILARWGWPGRVALLALGALLVAENLWISPAPYPVSHARLEVEPHLTELARTPGSGAVVDLPARFSPRFLNTRYFYLQIAHQRPIVHTINGPFSTLHLSLEHNALVQGLLSLEFPEQVAVCPGDDDLARGARELRTAGFDEVLVHRTFYADPVLRESTEALLGDVLGPPIHRSEQVTAFRLQRIHETVPGVEDDGG